MTAKTRLSVPVRVASLAAAATVVAAIVGNMDKLERLFATPASHPATPAVQVINQITPVTTSNSPTQGESERRFSDGMSSVVAQLRELGHDLPKREIAAADRRALEPRVAVIARSMEPYRSRIESEFTANSPERTRLLAKFDAAMMALAGLRDLMHISDASERQLGWQKIEDMLERNGFPPGTDAQLGAQRELVRIEQMSNDMRDISAAYQGERGAGHIVQNPRKTEQRELVLCRLNGRPGTLAELNVLLLWGQDCSALPKIIDEYYALGGTIHAILPNEGGQCGAGLFPVYSAFNDGFQWGLKPAHRYITDRRDYDGLLIRGWKGQPVFFCADLSVVQSLPP